MKGLKFKLIGLVLFCAGMLQAQVSVNVSIGAPPPWGPFGYSSVQYYYLPDVEAYYDVHSTMFIYWGGSGWIHRASLPSKYRNYDLYGGYKVVLKDYHGNAPYTYFKEHKQKYGRGYHGEQQKTIAEKPGKGNSGGKNSSEGNHHNKEGGGDHGNSKGNGHNGDDNGHGHDGGNGKQK